MKNIIDVIFEGKYCCFSCPSFFDKQLTITHGVTICKKYLIHLGSFLYGYLRCDGCVKKFGKGTEREEFK